MFDRLRQQNAQYDQANAESRTRREFREGMEKLWALYDKKELKDLERKKAAAERKARTHRLVEVGAILEQTSGMTFDTEDSRRALSVALTEQLRYTNGQPFTRGGQIAEAVGMLLGDQK